MLFNSYEFIFVFLPIVVLIYYFLNKRKLILAAKAWLAVSSLLFYSWWNLQFLPLLLLSILVNYGLGRMLSSGAVRVNRKGFLIAGIIFNVGLLCYYKYADFFISTFNDVFQQNIPLLKLLLPLAISFFTFQQIAYIVDCYRREVQESNLLSYTLFVVFFPQLIAGPIVHHKEMMPQFENIRNSLVNYKNQAVGIFIFSIGLFKKVILADSLAVWATQGFDQLEALTFIEGWVVSLSYTLQLYFDFSGYMDMAMGAALLFNIRLPVNFNSPYKSLSIQETWSRWHITLGQFLFRYIYSPMNRFLLRKVFTPLHLKKQVLLRTCVGLILLFLISGFWHGAGWTFIFWGFLHGLAMVIHRLWQHTGLRMNKVIAWFITFNFLNFSLVFFRANDFGDAVKVIKGMLGYNGIMLPSIYAELLPDFALSAVLIGDIPLNNGSSAVKYIVFGLIIILCFKNSVQLQERFKPRWYTVVFTAILFIYSVLHLTKETEFLYFNF